MLSAVGLEPLMGLCRQQGGSLSPDSMHIMRVCVCVCVCACSCLFVFVGVCSHPHMYACSKTLWVFMVKGWKRKASEESNHLLTARHDWKYAKYKPRKGDGYSPLACWIWATLCTILNRKRVWFLWAELNDKNHLLWHLQWKHGLTVKRTSAYLFTLLHFRCPSMIHQPVKAFSGQQELFLSPAVIWMDLNGFFRAEI